MRLGFDTTDVLLLHRQGRPCLLPGDGFSWWWRDHHFRYRTNDQREAYTDGLSSPQFTHVIASLESYGWGLPAAIPHDGGYHAGIEMERSDGTWFAFHLTKDECDQMLYELLLVLAGNDKAKQDMARVIYEAVRFFGQPAYDAGQAQAAQQRCPTGEVPA